MKRDDEFFGLANDETLTCKCLKEVVEQVLDGAIEDPSEPFDKTADRIEWPLKVFRFSRQPVVRAMERWAERLGKNALETMLADLDAEYGDPDGDATEPTDAMRSAAKLFAESVVREYVPWQCEMEGKPIEVTREQARQMVTPS